MRVNLTHIQRTAMTAIAIETRDLLLARQNAGPPEPALDGYTPLFDAAAAGLSTYVDGSARADAARATRLVLLGVADDEVDRWYRHNESYLAVEALRRTGTAGALARALHDKAFSDGLAHVDDRVEDENTYLRNALTILRAPEHANTLAAIEFPLPYLDQLEKAVTASDAALESVIAARDDKSDQVSAGQSAEDVWIDLMVRFRRYIGSRATRKGDKARYEEGLALLAPLTRELKRLQAEAAARATRAEAEAKPKAEAEAKPKAA
jgi:hypothetical protein